MFSSSNFVLSSSVVPHDYNIFNILVVVLQISEKFPMSVFSVMSHFQFSNLQRAKCINLLNVYDELYVIQYLIFKNNNSNKNKVFHFDNKISIGFA